jgi:hypothetical protein
LAHIRFGKQLIAPGLSDSRRTRKHCKSDIHWRKPHPMSLSAPQ